MPRPSRRLALATRQKIPYTYLEVGGLGVELIFNKNVIKLGDDKEYIKEAANTIAILRVK